MAATGEECFYLQPIRNYFDSGYDLTFDAAIEHYCAHFRENVIPARRCGTSCPAFEPLARTGLRDQSMTGNGVAINSPEARSKHIRDYLQSRLYAVRDTLRDMVKSLETQTQIQERQWQQVDAWLSQEETQPEVLQRDITDAEEEMDSIRLMQARIQRQLRATKTSHDDTDDFTQLWLAMDHWAIKMKHARERKERAETLLVQRDQHAVEHERLYAAWDDDSQRLSLLRRLRSHIADGVQARLDDTTRLLTDADHDRILGLLEEVSAVARYAASHFSVGTLQKKVEDFLQRALQI